MCCVLGQAVRGKAGALGPPRHVRKTFRLKRGSFRRMTSMVLRSLCHLSLLYAAGPCDHAVQRPLCLCSGHCLCPRVRGGGRCGEGPFRLEHGQSV